MAALAVAIVQGCGHPRTSRSFVWPADGAGIDSVSRMLDIKFNDYVPADSLAADISRLDSVVSVDSREDVSARVRLDYWRARYMSRIENHDSALVLARAGLALVDSQTHMYDYLRLKVLECAEDPVADGSVKFRVFEQALDYCEREGDNGFEAYVCMQMGNLLESIRSYDRSLRYLSRADSLHSLLGFEKMVVKNGINRARVLEARGEEGDSVRSDSIMRALVDHPALDGDTATQNVVLRNIYISSKDKNVLIRAYRQVETNPRFRHLRGLYRALLANHNFFEGNHDSTIYYSDLAIEDLPYVNEPAHVAHIWLVAGLVWMIRENPDSALQCRLRYEEYYNMAAGLRQEAEVLRLTALNDISSRESEYRLSIFRRNMVIMLILVIVVASAVVLAFVLNRRHIRMKMSSLSKELELEKSKRKMAAAALTIEEKNNVLGALKQELSEMREEGVIQEQGARHLETTIKAHLVDNDSTEAFNAMFDHINPHFTGRLRELCPDLAESYVRLACYILMDLDNRRIAALMMIRPESVRQAKWRLSRKLGLGEGVMLETFLRNLNKP